MFNVIFPRKLNQHYYDIHYAYVLELFRYLNCTIEFQDNLDVDNTAFKVSINGKWFIFDFADSNQVRNLGDFPIFKFHTKHTDLDKVIPFSPVSFYNWKRYYELEKEINYVPRIGYISSRQRPYAGATIRRYNVQKLLKEYFGSAVLTDLINQEDYWKEINNIQVAVMVPGQNNNIWDRGHSQYMAFGCCTISPNLPEVLPFGKIFIPDVNYIICKDDYSDLIDIIHNMTFDKCLSIGQQAKQLFQKTSTPDALGRWIKEQL